MKDVIIKYCFRKNIANLGIWKLLCLILLITSFTTACDDFVDVDLPKNQLTAETVFADAATATAALRSIYAKMRDEGLVSSLSRRLGLYADELDDFTGQSSFYSHTLSELDTSIKALWSRTYNLIYEANAVVEGIENSSTLSLEDKNQFKGEALVIRAYLHALLVELWGPIPYSSTTDYVANTTVSRMPLNIVYSNIINDLMLASGLLGNDISTDRTRVYAEVADAFLARAYLYTQQWELAEDMASRVINKFVLEADIDKVFLKNSSESIWQFKPAFEGQNTQDADNFIYTGRPTGVALSESFVLNEFELGDLRLSNWVGSTTSPRPIGIGVETWYYAFKYKEDSNTFIINGLTEIPTSFEYPVILRLAEQYLIRAEAKAELGDIAGAQSDLNVIRIRAGLTNTTAANTNELLVAILQERRVELFTEQGHRWFDLKRTGKAATVLAPIKPGWRDTDILFPIPESEILLNPNLLPQNDGYN